MERESGPLVSVLMGVRYRREDISLLKRSVESILSQTFSDFEFIICDTGSNAHATEYLESLTDERVRLVREDGCLDLARKLNLCLKHARGCYIARMDDDDYAHADRLEKQIAFLLDRPEISFVGSSVAVMEDGEFRRVRRFPALPAVEDFFLTQPFIHPTLVFRRKALEAAGGYSEDRRCLLCEDYDLLLRLYERAFTGANLDEALLDYSVFRRPDHPRKMKHRVNEAVIRYRRFKALGRLPGAWPYVLKPVAVGLLPQPLVRAWRDAKSMTSGGKANEGKAHES